VTDSDVKRYSLSDASELIELGSLQGFAARGPGETIAVRSRASAARAPAPPHYGTRRPTIADTANFDSYFSAPEPEAPALSRAGDRLGELTQLDDVAVRLADAVKQAVPAGPAKDVLSGSWLGHPLHPVLSDVPIGTWTSAVLLDLLGGEEAEQGADRLVALGILSSLPTVAAGMSDWADTMGAERRTGLVHAAANAAALSLFSASYLARRAGRRRSGVLLGLLGAGSMSVGGWIGGHLSYALGVGVDSTAFESPPGEWTAVLAESDLAEGEPKPVELGAITALVTKLNGHISAISSTCTHRGGPLDQGTVEDGCVTCPLHGSQFELSDGSVVRGPATVPQPTFDVRVRDGQVELRGA
jgi:nitrite reductase/ring-hydroxylating ferredoxin subunit/uncharacterized membrane protein